MRDEMVMDNILLTTLLETEKKQHPSFQNR